MALFFGGKGTISGQETKRDHVSWLGICLQGVSFGCISILKRPLFSPIVDMPKAVEVIMAAVTIGIAIGSALLVFAAFRALGRQWAFTARLVVGHKLIMEGPYLWVRNPIYTAIFGMMIATGLAVSQWTAFPPAILVFIIGTVIRVRSEEKLLREAFGSEFDEYAHRVPVFLPGIY